MHPSCKRDTLYKVKVCTECGVEKSEEEFGKKGDRRLHRCKQCINEYQRQHYEQNKEKYKRKAKTWNHKVRKRYQQLKEATPCDDCGGMFPYYVTEYDHRDPSTKADNVASLISRGVGWEKLMAEIEKCDLVCANCHRQRTHSRRISSTGRAAVL